MRTKAAGLERYVLALALVLPLGLTLLIAAQVPGVHVELPSAIAYADAATAPITLHRPAVSKPTPPPTLVPAPTPTRAPAPAAAIAPTPTNVAERTYTVQPGDELKHIAADYGVNIWKIINANDIPNPDSLRVGQVLKIPNS
jgi:LysM repeat protein